MHLAALARHAAGIHGEFCNASHDRRNLHDGIDVSGQFGHDEIMWLYPQSEFMYVDARPELAESCVVCENSIGNNFAWRNTVLKGVDLQDTRTVQTRSRDLKSIGTWNTMRASVYLSHQNSGISYVPNSNIT